MKSRIFADFDASASAILAPVECSLAFGWQKP
jgi:hypothetical protein